MQPNPVPSFLLAGERPCTNQNPTKRGPKLLHHHMQPTLKVLNPTKTLNVLNIQMGILQCSIHPEPQCNTTSANGAHMSERFLHLEREENHT